MKTLDRYIARQFAFNFIMLFMVLVGLYALLDLIVNFDEFVQAAQIETGGWFDRLASLANKVYSFYWPRIFLLYTYMAGLLPIGAAGFTFASLIRHRELVAMLAGGISLHRIVMPVVVLTLVANALLLANQELLLPRLAARLLESHSILNKDKSLGMKLRFVSDGNGALFTALGFDPQTDTITSLTILERERLDGGRFGRATARITADQAHYDEARGGWELTQGFRVRDVPVSIDPTRGGSIIGQVEPLDLFVTDLDPRTILLRERDRFRTMLSLRQLSELIGKPRVVDVPDLLRIRQARFSTIVINLLILGMGLPFFLMRVPGSLLVPVMRCAMVCIPAWAGGFVMHQLNPGFLPPAAVAWMPVALYLPLAYYLLDSVET